MRIQRIAITILLVVIIILGGITVNWDNPGISTQVAVGQVDDADLQYLERANNAFIRLKHHKKLKKTKK